MAHYGIARAGTFSLDRCGVSAHNTGTPDNVQCEGDVLLNTVKRARLWITCSCLVISCSLYLFFTLATSFGYPLAHNQSARLIQMIIPVLFSYLGSAATFVFRTPREENLEMPHKELSSVLLIGPIVLFCVGAIGILVAFGISNSGTAASGSGMDIDALAGDFTYLLGLLTLTTAVAVSYLFSVEKR
jgi:hypothetical protein